MSLAPSVFSSGIDEKLAAVDAYKLNTATQTINLIESFENNPATFSNLVSGNTGDLSGIVKGMDSQKNLIIDKDLFQKGLALALPTFSSALASISPDIRGNLLKADIPSQIQVTVGGVQRLVSGADYGSLNGIGSMVGALAGSDFGLGLKDIKGLERFTAAIINQAAQLGIPGAYTKIATGILIGGDKNLLTRITRAVLPVVIGRNNLSLLQEIASGPIGNKIGQLFPDTVGRFLSVFKTNPRAGRMNPVELAIRTLQTFKIIKPDWNRRQPYATRRPGSNSRSKDRQNALILIAASAAARQLFGQAARSKPINGPTNVRITRVQNASSILNPAQEFPAGTTSESQSNPDGTNTTVYLLPNGAVVRRTVRADQKVVSEYSYPPSVSRPYSQASATRVYQTLSGNSQVNVKAPAATSQVPQERITTNSSLFGLSSFGAGAYSYVGQDNNGEAATFIETPTGARYMYQENSNAESYAQALIPTAMPAVMPQQPTDPFIGWPSATVNDDLFQAGVAIDVYEQARQRQQQSARPSLITQDAAQALVMQFPSVAWSSA